MESSPPKNDTDEGGASGDDLVVLDAGLGVIGGHVRHLMGEDCGELAVGHCDF